MGNTITSVRALTAALITFGSLAGMASGAAVITFTESGGNVIATTLGILLEPIPTSSGTGDARAAIFGSGIVVGSTTNWVNASGGLVSGSFSGAITTIFASSYTGPRIGANATAAALLYGDDTPWSAALTSTAVWNSRTLASFNLSPSDNFTLTYSTVGGGEDTLTVEIVPEPSSLILIGLSAMSLAVRRRTNR